MVTGEKFVIRKFDWTWVKVTKMRLHHHLLKYFSYCIGRLRNEKWNDYNGMLKSSFHIDLGRKALEKRWCELNLNSLLILRDHFSSCLF